MIRYTTPYLNDARNYSLKLIIKAQKFIRLNLLLVFILSYIYPQNKKDIEFEPKNFPGKENELKNAIQNLKKGDDIFMGKGIFYYKDAIPFYMEAYEFNPNNSELNYKLGKCYLYSPGNKNEALRFLLEAYELNPEISLDICYLIGTAYHLTGNYNKAIEFYKKQLDVFSQKAGQDPKRKRQFGNIIEEIQKKIKECEFAKNIKPVFKNAKVINLGPSINSPYTEYGPVVVADESKIYFTSRRKGTTGGKIDKLINDYFEDIFVAERIGENKWSKAKPMDPPINTDNHESIIGLTPDGLRVLIYKADKGGDGNIYEAEVSGGKWGKPIKLPEPINSPFHESSAAYGPDGRTLYFTTLAPYRGGMGGRDIWVSRKDEKGNWSPPENLGPTVNTPKDEEGVFIHPDGRTLFFSSNGHPTMGGFDIFRTYKGDDGKWSNPENLGPPINSPYDDVFFYLAPSGDHAYFSSIRNDAIGEKDIYVIYFEIKEEEKPKVTVFRGKILDHITGKPIEAEIEIIDNTTGELFGKFKSNATDGKFILTLPSGKNYGISINAKGYLFHSENLNIPAHYAFREVVKDITLKPIKIGAVVALRNIFFEYNSATLLPESYPELNRVYKILIDNPTVKLELSGHTDSIGGHEYNMRLSQQRAESVRNYLLEKGISPSRLIAKGYGLTKPIAPNSTEEGRALNRRVEMKILEE